MSVSGLQVSITDLGKCISLKDLSAAERSNYNLYPMFFEVIIQNSSENTL